jgi:hypothetical protein
MKIIIETIPHTKQRYETVGDWIFKNGDLYVFVSDMKSINHEFLVGIHEAIEAMLCKRRHIDERVITDFDINFEKNRKKGNTDEPGDSPKAPYRKEHFFATTIERLVALELGVDWKKYDDKVNSL